MANKVITAAALRETLGGVSDMTIWRWQKSAELGFPHPIKIQGRRYWREADVLDWLDRQAGKAGA